jgi:hypothetical protein
MDDGWLTLTIRADEECLGWSVVLALLVLWKL